MNDKATAKRLIAVLAVALAIRCGAAVWWDARTQGRFVFPDSESYWALGGALARGEPYRIDMPHMEPHGARVFRTPGYPALLAPVFVLVPEPHRVLAARLQAALFGTLSVAGVWWLARRLFDEQAALLAAGAAAVDPGAIVTSVLVLAEAPFCPLMLAQLGLWTGASGAANLRRLGCLGALAGLAGGLATLMRPSWLLFTPLAAVLFLLAALRPSREPRRVSLRRAAVVSGAMAAGLAAVLAPWWVRNAQVTGRLVPTTLQVGASLYDGLSPQATGASDMDFVEPIAAEERRQWEAAGRPGDFEVWLDGAMRRRAVNWAASNPRMAGRLAAVKAARMWNVWPNEPSLSTWPVRLAMVFTFVPVLIFGIIGAARTLGRGWGYALAWLPAAYFTALHMVFVGSIRYRQPAMLGLMVLAAGAAMAVWRRRS